MAIVLDGNLGITSPAETVQGALTTTGNTILGDATTDTLNVGAGGLVKDASGNVGIGTSSPWSQISSYGASGATTQFIGFKNADGGDIRFGKASGVDNTCLLGTFTSNRIKFYTNSVNVMDLDTNGNLLFNSGYGSAATAYGCRAWVNFNGTGTVAIRGSGNVSSITDNGTGDYTVNFTTAMPDVNYVVAPSSASSATGSGTATAVVNNQANMVVGSVRIIVTDFATTQDRTYVAVAIFR